jgi:AraC family transcriptional regulator
MAANLAFHDYARIPTNNIIAEQRQSAECRFCRGTGRISSSPSVAAPCTGFPRYMMRRIEELLNSRLEGRDSIAAIAGIIGYSPSHFFRMFRRSFGITPHTYLMRQRLAVAQHLLTGSDLCIADIALKAGFCDQAHLSRTFRKSTGTTPRAFRALNRAL